MRGLAEAAGAHVWFADPDDLLAEGSLAAVGSSPRGWPSRYRPDSSEEGTVSALESSRWE